MLLTRIPVRIFANDPHEMAAFSDILASGQAGNLTLPEPQEQALVALICPSGQLEDAAGLPAVSLGGVAETAHVLPLPARLHDIFDALETIAQETTNLSGPRAHGGWVLDYGRLTLRDPDGQAISLTDTEARLLAMLFDAGGVELDKEALLQRVWGYRPGLDTHTLETHIYRLRQKIEPNPTSPRFLMTTEAGYRLA
ncbi:MAG: winged helix family transcriptional regulator [Proteobacteria bacterium]|nr:winged helix family transcriptional regulator [Pseudomonadota bacterium]